jgi:ferritin
VSKQLISETINESLNELVGQFFEGNRFLDRAMSQLSIKFTMSKTSKILHEALAHKMPLLADFLSNYQDSRNALTIYPETFKDDTDYENPLAIFTKFLDYMISVERSIIEVIDLTKDENDYMTKVFLEKFLYHIHFYTNQALLLVDKSNMYGQDNKGLMDFDRDINDFIVDIPIMGKQVIVSEGD